jgi:hypothetical protein
MDALHLAQISSEPSNTNSLATIKDVLYIDPTFTSPLPTTPTIVDLQKRLVGLSILINQGFAVYMNYQIRVHHKSETICSCGHSNCIVRQLPVQVGEFVELLPRYDSDVFTFIHETDPSKVLDMFNSMPSPLTERSLARCRNYCAILFMNHLFNSLEDHNDALGLHSIGNLFIKLLQIGLRFRKFDPIYPLIMASICLPDSNCPFLSYY